MMGVTLIVDDSLTVRADLQEAFEQAGLPTIACASVAEARAVLATQAMDLIILDVVLPDGDGVELLKEIRAMPVGADIPVLMLSTESEVRDRIRGLMTGSNDYVGKPYDQEYVITRARELLGHGSGSQAQPTTRAKVRVLIIDDSVTFRERLGDLLRAQGFDVLNAASGEEGLRSAAANRPDAMVVDGVLPGIDGSTVVRKLRLDAALRHTPCILLTGSEDHGAELRALDSGADAFVRKEEDLDVMLARIIAVLRNIRSASYEGQTTSLHGPKKILAVDDSITYLQELGETLRGEGYDVILAHSGEEALEMIAVQAVDCILLDRLMPGLGGTETCRRIKASPAWRDIPLIMHTAMEDREAMIEGLSTGADDYVLKSNELDVLKARLRAQLRRKQFEDEGQRVRIELMKKELEAAEVRAARELFESRAALLLILEQKNRDLEAVNRELLSHQTEIAEKNLELEEASRLKSEFLSNMSHEIRSPLNAILGLAYLLEHAHLDHNARDMVNKIRTSGRSLLGIINDVLDVSKIEAGHMVIEQTPFRLDDVMDNLASSMGIAAGNKGIELIIQAPPAGISAVMGDSLRLEQVLVNLTSNAIKFTDTGRVELSTELLSRHEEKITLRFCVKDTGIGIAPEAQSKVFSPFTQADSSTTRRFGGTGLGLAICRQLVGLMEGEMGLTSTLGQGSEFWFTLPLLQISSVDFSSPNMVSIDALVADDNPIALQAVVTIAQGLGWHVSAMDSGEAVLAQVLKRKDGQLPNVVVLMDVQMPGMDGLAIARAIREGIPQKECPIVILVTAYSPSSLANQPGAEMVDAILNKPLSTSTLYYAVVEAQRRRATTGGIPHALQQMASQGLNDVRVLVVDDGEINREVAQRILREQGATVTLAIDGRAALDWLLAHPDDVDLVLMDVQMPVMDGIEATRQLRLLPQFKDLPIVALTAGAFKSQQEAAQAAGMTDFISKPFDVPSTIALIRRLRRRPAAAPTDIQSTANTAPAGQAGISQPSGASVIDIAKGLQIWSSVPAYRNYLRRFSDSYGNAVEVMNASLAADDRPAAAALAHKLGGAAGNMALPDTHRLAGEAERVLTEGYDPTQTLARLRDALEQVVVAVEWFAPRAVAHVAPASPDLAADDMTPEAQARLKMLLIELLAALDTDNPFPVETILAKLAQQCRARELAPIQASVRGFDFRGAEASAYRLATEHGIVLKAQDNSQGVNNDSS